MPSLLTPATGLDELKSQQLCQGAMAKMSMLCGNTMIPSLDTIQTTPPCAQAVKLTHDICCDLPSAEGWHTNPNPMCDLLAWQEMQYYAQLAPGLRVAVPRLGIRLDDPDVDISLQKADTGLQNDMLPPHGGATGFSSDSVVTFTPRDDETRYRCLSVGSDDIVRNGSDVYAEKLFCCPWPPPHLEDIPSDQRAAEADRHVADVRYDMARCPGEDTPGQISRVFSWDVVAQQYK